MHENYSDCKELSETLDIYHSSLNKINNIIEKKNFQSHFRNIGIDEILGNLKIKNKEIKINTSKINN